MPHFMIPKISLSFMMASSSSSILTSVPDHLPNSTRSPFDFKRHELAALVAHAGADGDHFALHRLLLGGVGNDDAATTTRSCRGRKTILMCQSTPSSVQCGRPSDSYKELLLAISSVEYQNAPDFNSLFFKLCSPSLLQGHCIDLDYEVVRALSLYRQTCWRIQGKRFLSALHDDVGIIYSVQPLLSSFRVCVWILSIV